MLPKIGVNMPCGERFWREKYYIYLTNSGQGIAFWTFFETTRVSAVLADHRDYKNKNICYFLFFLDNKMK
jgi:hypothetical protein